MNFLDLRENKIDQNIFVYISDQLEFWRDVYG
jgi:hypothetical protein